MKKGILLPMFSLPSKYGMGDFGNEAYEFIDILRENNIDYWQVLPLNEGGQYPYSPISYYALNKNFLSIDKLIEYGLLDKKEVKFKKKSSRIKYDNFKDEYIKLAFSRFYQNAGYLKFIQKKEIQEFAEYMSKHFGESKEFYLFEQYFLDRQYKELKQYANMNGVKIIGDLPIYPDYNSVEREYNEKYYDLVDGKMEYVSGASPDYFNSEGQKWGHPLYNFKAMEEDGFEYLLKRYKEFLSRYDVTRIDHFRAFDTYFKIPVDKSAKEGHYEEGPGSKFMDKLFEFAKSENFIVEDLGDIRKETEELRDKYGFMKMKILHYTLNLKSGSDDYLDVNNMVVYTGNHDNNTTLGWYNSLTEEEKFVLINFLKSKDCYEGNICDSMIKYALKSIADLVVIPVQDILGLDEDARINVPGNEFDDQWSWELLDFEALKKKIDIMNRWNS